MNFCIRGQWFVGTDLSHIVIQIFFPLCLRAVGWELLGMRALSAARSRVDAGVFTSSQLASAILPIKPDNGMSI